MADIKNSNILFFTIEFINGRLRFKGGWINVVSDASFIYLFVVYLMALSQ
jgi:hypothetical protein